MEISLSEDVDIKIRIESINYINDVLFLKDIYDNQSNIDLKNASKSKLEGMFSTNARIVNYLCDLIDVDDEILVNIALTDSDYFPGAGWAIAGTKPAVKYGYPIRCKALSKIKKEDSFVKFAKEINTEIEFPEFDDEPEQDPKFRRLTLNMAKYGKYIREAREDDLEVLCRYAIKNISNEDALCDIALNAKFWISRILAVEKMSDRKILEYVSKNDFYEDVRLAAEKRLDEVKKMKIMFVCAGNTSRSAMAEGIFKKMHEDIEVYSSGVIALTGKKSSQKTIDVCKSHGIDLSKHKATHFKDSNIEDMDLVLTFEQYQTSKIQISYPDLKICTIKEFIGEYPPDINDPVGGDSKVYDACCREICRVLKKASEKIEKEYLS